jgi:hypothetical protein
MVEEQRPYLHRAGVPSSRALLILRFTDPTRVQSQSAG